MTTFSDTNDAYQHGIRPDIGWSETVQPPPNGNGRDAQEGHEEWSLPTPFHTYDLPAFPTDVLAPWLREYVRAESTATQTPEDLPGMLTLTTCAAALARKAVLQIKPGWKEPFNIYTVTVQPPAARKSQVFRDVTKPLEKFEQEKAEEQKLQIAMAQASYRIAESNLRQAEKAATHAKGENKYVALADVEKCTEELAAVDVPVPCQLIADDVTPEKLSMLIRDQGGRMAVMSPEGGGPFALMAGRYTKNGAPNFEVYLKGHAGDTLRVDRVNRPPDHVLDPALTLGLTVQPEVIQSMVVEPGFRGRGLLARFHYSLPRSLIGLREVDPPPVSDDIQEAYMRSVRALLDWQPESMTDDGPQAKQEIIEFTTGSRKTLLTFAKELEPKLADDAELGAIADWGGKLAGAVARISGLLHITDRAADSSACFLEPIEARTVERAIIIGKYLIPHAQAAFTEMGANPATDAAKHVLSWLKRKQHSEFSRAETYRDLRRGRFRSPGDLDPALKLLLDHGYIRERAIDITNGPGRPRSPVFEVNPLFDAPTLRRKLSKLPWQSDDDYVDKVDFVAGA